MAFAGKFEDGFDDCYNYGDGEELDSEIDEFWGISERQEEEELNDAYDDWRGYCSTLEKTEWFKGKIKPEYVGVYETQSKAWPYPSKSYWDGNKWCFYNWFDNEPYGEVSNKVTQWRGITEEAHQEALQHQLDKSLDKLLDTLDE